MSSQSDSYTRTPPAQGTCCSSEAAPAQRPSPGTTKGGHPTLQYCFFTETLGLGCFLPIRNPEKREKCPAPPSSVPKPQSARSPPRKRGPSGVLRATSGHLSPQGPPPGALHHGTAHHQPCAPAPIHSKNIPGPDAAAGHRQVKMDFALETFADPELI